MSRQIQIISEREAYDMFDDMLDECYEEYHIGYVSYTPSQILREVDPTAYRCGFLDYIDSLVDSDIYVEDYTAEDLEPADYPDPDSEYESRFELEE